LVCPGGTGKGVDRAGGGLVQSEAIHIMAHAGRLRIALHRDNTVAGDHVVDSMYCVLRDVVDSMD